jgi:RNA polymerase sigma factor (sigma-70 family)
MTEILASDSFEQLLKWLHEDREEAAKLYQRIRGKLISFFRWRGVAQADDLADWTIDRVSRKIAEGTPRDSVDPGAFFYGVARNILKEHRSKQARGVRALADFAAESARRLSDEEAEDQELRSVRLECLETCLARLSTQTREIIVEYYRGERAEKIEFRKALAVRLGIPINALWIRSHRIRLALETCIEKCLKDHPTSKGMRSKSH